MSGALPQYRTPSRPTGEIKGFKHVLRPGGVYKDGRCVEWIIDYVPVFRHVLAYPPESHRPSKHRNGLRPRTPKERREAERNRARRIQISKSITVDENTLGAIYDDRG